MNLKDLKKLIPEIFEKVKNDVRKVTGRHRAGLSLKLAEIRRFSSGGFIGGWHLYPGTEIGMNLIPLKIIINKSTDEVIWAYTYHILLHEYIHSFGVGVYKEEECKASTLYISEQIFKDENHWAVKIAKHGIGIAIPYLQIKTDYRDWELKGIPPGYVKGFDRESQPYFS